MSWMDWTQLALQLLTLICIFWMTNRIGEAFSYFQQLTRKEITATIEPIEKNINKTKEITQQLWEHADWVPKSDFDEGLIALKQMTRDFNNASPKARAFILESMRNANQSSDEFDEGE